MHQTQPLCSFFFQNLADSIILITFARIFVLICHLGSVHCRQQYLRVHLCLHIPIYGDPRKLSLQRKVMLRNNEVHWFPLRIRNSSLVRLQTMKDRLDRQDDILGTYVPLSFIKVSLTKMDFAPFLLNYIFVRSTFEKLVAIKQNQELFEPLRFVMHPVLDDDYHKHHEVLFISDRKMEDYIRVTSEENEKVIFLDNIAYACKPSQEVQITEGRFAGVVGRIKRIRGQRCVVLPIGYEMAAAVVDVPNKYLRYMTPEEIAKLPE